MRHVRLVLTSLVTLSLLASCGNSMFDPMDPSLEGARLEIVGSPAVNLRYSDAVDLRVRYVRMDGSLIENAPIDYAIVGDPVGSRLGALQTPTDTNGEAAVSLVAGNAEAMFDVTVTPPRGDGVSFSIAVSDTDAGSIVVSMTYAGTRDLVRFDTFLFEGESCAMMNPTALPTALRSAPSVSSIAAMPAFAGVPVGSDYAIAVVARSTANVAAFGCRDRRVVMARTETPVAVTLADTVIGADFVGVWDLDNRFDFGGTLPESVQTFLDVLDELTDDSSIDGERIADTDMDGVFPEFGVDPGAFITDIIMRQTCHWECAGGEDYDTCSETNHRLGDLRLLYMENFTSWSGAQSRFTGGCGAWEFIHVAIQNEINDLINSFVPDFVTNWFNLAGDLARAINDAHILSVLEINRPTAGDEFALPMRHELVQMVVDLRDPTATPPGMRRSFTFSLADAGFTSLTVTEITTVDGTTLNIPSHSFTLNWGRLVLYIYREIFLNRIFGYMDTGEMFADLIDCNVVGDWIVEEVCSCDTTIPGDCAGCIISPSTAAGYCVTGLSAAGAAIEGAITDFLDIDGTLTIQGTAEGRDINMETGRVDTLANGMWSGSWGEAATTETITGTFTGVRRTGM